MCEDITKLTLFCKVESKVEQMKNAQLRVEKGKKTCNTVGLKDGRRRGVTNQGCGKIMLKEYK